MNILSITYTLIELTFQLSIFVKYWRELFSVNLKGNRLIG
jgi:hypothetical protein